MNFGYSEKDGSVYIYFKPCEIENACSYFSAVKELEEKNKREAPLFEDIASEDKSSGMLCFKFSFENREFVTRILEIMIEGYRVEYQLEEINKLESILEYINFSQNKECLN